MTACTSSVIYACGLSPSPLPTLSPFPSLAPSALPTQSVRTQVQYPVSQKLENVTEKQFQVNYTQNANLFKTTVARTMGLIDKNYVVINYPKQPAAALRSFRVSLLGSTISRLTINYTVFLVLGEGNQYSSVSQAVDATKTSLVRAISSKNFTRNLNEAAKASGSVLMKAMANANPIVGPVQTTLLTMQPSPQPTLRSTEKSSFYGMNSTTVIIIGCMVILAVLVIAGSMYYFYCHDRNATKDNYSGEKSLSRSQSQARDNDDDGVYFNCCECIFACCKDACTSEGKSKGNISKPRTIESHLPKDPYLSPERNNDNGFPYGRARGETPFNQANPYFGRGKPTMGDSVNGIS